MNFKKEYPETAKVLGQERPCQYPAGGGFQHLEFEKIRYLASRVPGREAPRGSFKWMLFLWLFIIIINLFINV
jgi:hypothetical protein